jgi:hypothetical protein
MKKMMKATVTILMMVMVMSSYAQLTITETKDDMTDKVSYTPSEGLICATEDMRLGFRIDPNITVKKDKKVIENLIITMVGLESCNENNKMIILFENGEKLNLVSWNKFNCKGTAYFSLTTATINKLKENEIAKIRLSNGKSYKSYTSELEYKRYFIELFGLLVTPKQD